MRGPAIVLLLLAVAAALVPLPQALVESVYAAHVFPALQRTLTLLSNRVPFAVLDVLAAVAASWLIASLAAVVLRRHRTAWPRALGHLGLHLVMVAAAAYLVFLVAWGFNYQRVPLKERLDFDTARVSDEAVLSLSHEVVARVNALHASAMAEGWGHPGVVDEGLARAFERAQRDVGATKMARPARPKWTVFDPYFTRAAVAGMTDPYFLETLVASDLLPFERPFVIAHEWSHLAGRADEGEANFLGWLTCLSGSASHQYSGWLFLYGEVLDALEPRNLPAVAARLAAGPRADIDAVRARLLRHVNPVVQRTGWQVYDQYLKANRVERGARSYGEVITLILGTRFTESWHPALR